MGLLKLADPKVVALLMAAFLLLQGLLVHMMEVVLE